MAQIRVGGGGSIVVALHELGDPIDKSKWPPWVGDADAVYKIGNATKAPVTYGKPDDPQLGAPGSTEHYQITIE